MSTRSRKQASFARRPRHWLGICAGATGLFFLLSSVSAWAVDVPVKWCVIGNGQGDCAEGIGTLKDGHFSGTIVYEGAVISLSGEIVEDELDIDMSGPIMGRSGAGGGSGNLQCLGHGSAGPVTGKMSMMIDFTCQATGHGTLSLDLRGIAATSTATAAPQPAAPPVPAAAALPPLDAINAIYVAVDLAKVRGQPDALSARVKTLDAGQKIKVLGKLHGEDWYLVSENDKPLGYVIANQLVPEAQYHPAVVPAAAALPAVVTPATVAPAVAAPQPAIPPALAALDFGRYEALVVGNDRYQGGLPALKTATADANAVAEVLRNDYGFTVTVLLNATRDQIIGTLAKFRRTLTWDDNLLIYYAGHGSFDQEADQGYWLPVDAAVDDPSNWISNGDITNMVKAIQARHIMVVADSCYSGTLTRGAAVGIKDADYIQRMVAKKARTVMTSGGLEPVADSGGGGHSVFATAFIAALRQNNGVMDAQSFFAKVRDPVVLAETQTPEYSNLRFAGHEGGDFIFVRKQ